MKSKSGTIKFNGANFHGCTSQGGGGRGGLQPPQLQKFLKFFGQKADDSGKSTREKTFPKGSQRQT